MPERMTSLITSLITRFKDLPFERKVRYSYLIVVLPIVIVLFIYIGILYYESNVYGAMMDTVGYASQFSLGFKEDFDYETYLVIVESKKFDDSELRQMLDNANDVVRMLKEEVSIDSENLKRLENTEKYLNNLETYINRIETNLKEGDRYDDNIKIWENDVQIVTALIRESIIQFIYFELKDIQQVKAEYDVMYTRMISAVIVAGIVILTLVIVLSYRISRSITRPIREISKVTEAVSRGDLSVRTNVSAGAEVGVLAKSLDEMIDRINLLLVQVKQEQISLRKTELELLQSQINPHFLYNTLDTIVWLAEDGDQHEVVSMVKSLSEFFRSTLSAGKDVVPIAEEIKHITSYLQIQQVRYQDILEYEIDIDESMHKYLIPKITIQPLVENALYHGIKNKRGKGKIHVYGKLYSNYMILYVKDNGIGIKEDRLLQIQEKINNTDERDDDAFGLHNVNERIRLKFGTRYGIHIESEYTKGTKVSIFLPLIIENPT